MKLGYPLQDHDFETCLEKHTAGKAGFYPIGLKNRSWHPGIHIKASPDTPICAVADGKIIAFRFQNAQVNVKKNSSSGEQTSQTVDYSHSFVLIEHNFESSLGNALRFFSLYMHLDPKPEAQQAPQFLRENKFVVSSDSILPSNGILLYEEEAFLAGGPNKWNSIGMPAKGAVVEKCADQEGMGESGYYQKVTYKESDGKTVRTGVIANVPKRLKKINETQYLVIS